MLADFQNPFTIVRYSFFFMKIAMPHFPPNLKRVSALPCEI